MQFLNVVNLCMKRFSYLTLCVLVFAGCSREVYKLQPVKEISTANPSLIKLEQSFKNGIDFIASGDIPKPWVLEMDFENQFVFKTATDSLSLLSVSPTNTSTEKIFTLRDRAGNLDIKIGKNGCEGNDRKLPTTVVYKNNTYKNCGEYLFDTQIEGRWQILMVGNVALSINDYPEGLPIIIFDIENKVFKGESSCLKFSTSMEIEGPNIKVNNGNALAASNCNKVILLTHFKENILGKWMSYKIDGDNLYLYLSDDSNIRLRKTRPQTKKR